MSGVVGVIADQAGRYTAFMQSLTSLSVPVNTGIDYEIGADRGVSRNALVRRSLERGAEWILFLDDDGHFPPFLLRRLLSHEQPIVASLYLRRAAPFVPIAFAERDEDGNYWPLDLTKCPEDGLVQVIGAGTGGMLIRSEVFHQLEDPWFVHTTEQSEDLHFCAKAVEAGIPIYVDLGAKLGHIAPAVVYPTYEGGQWCAGLNFASSTRIVLPIDA